MQAPKNRSRGISRDPTRINQNNRRTHIFFALINTSGYLRLCCEGLVLVGVYLVFSEHREWCFDIEFLISHFPGGHDGRRFGMAEVGKEAYREGKIPKKFGLWVIQVMRQWKTMFFN